MSTVRIDVCLSITLNSETVLLLGVVRSSFPWIPGKLSRLCNEEFVK